MNASWEEDSSKKTLQKINLNIRSGQICGVIGTVGAGKVELTE